MAEIALTDCFCYVSSQDYTTVTNSATLGTDVAQLDATTFNSGGWQELAAGLKSFNLAYSGFWDSNADNRAFVDIQAGTARTCTVGANEVEGSLGVAYMLQARNSQYTALGAVGELAPFSVTANGSSGVGVVRGRLAKTKGTVSATGALGTGLQLGAVAADKSLYATFHIFTIGTSITIEVQSDDNSDFTTPTTVATIGPLTVGGGTWMTPVAGAITDNWYRFNVSAITGTHTVAGAIGIQ